VSSGGLILLWVLLMTLFLPDLNYARSYASVAQQIAARLPAEADCIETNVGPAQRASFAYFGHLPLANVEHGQCSFLLVQDSTKSGPPGPVERALAEGRVIQHGDGVWSGREVMQDFRPRDWTLMWEGRRASDRLERFRLYRRTR